MKFWFFVLFLFLAFIYEVENFTLLNKQFVKEQIINISKNIFTPDELRNLEQSVLNASHNTSVLNNYLDLIIPGINELIFQAKLDPIKLPNNTIDIKIGKSDLTEGTLSGLSTLERYGNVTVSYSEKLNKVSIELILAYNHLKIIYKYHTKVMLTEMNGHVTAVVKDLKIHLKFGFNFNTTHISVDALDFNNTGNIKLKFTEVAPVDWITNAMSSLFTPFFYDLYLSIIKKVTMNPVEEVVNTFNAAIDNIIHLIF